MIAKTDRTWAPPEYPWIMRMTWSELLFAHWPIDANKIAPLLPKGLTLDTREGTAWLGIVPFLMSNVAPRICPALPKFSCFPELNVRTYVTYGGKPGVWFFSLDAANRLAVRTARSIFHLPYMDANMFLTTDDLGVTDFRSGRTHRGERPARLEASYRAIGEGTQALSGTLEHWLTARYCLYSAGRNGRLYRGEIDHDPWTLSQATWTVRHNTMCEPLEIDVIGQPHLMFAQPITVRAWPATGATGCN